MTPQPYYTTVLSNGMLAVPLPEELRGKSVKIIVEQEPAPQTGILSIAGILKDYRNDDFRDDQMIETSSKKGILGLRGILKDCSMEELENARYEYLMEKYVHD